MTACEKTKDLETLRFTNGLSPIFFDPDRDSPLHPDSQKKMNSSEDCSSCHERIYANWNQSMHRVSFTNPIYQDSHRDEPMEWCLNCHAPLALRKEEGGENVRYRSEEGVSCISCHVRNGKILISEKKAHLSSAHEYEFVPMMKEEEFCGNCHQFPWPRKKSLMGKESTIVYSNVPMQDTIGEYKQSFLKKSRNCQSCHLFPNSRFSHSFPGGHNQSLLADSFSVDLKRISRQTFQLKVFAIGIGHSFPTGDLFRSMRIRILTSNGYLIQEWILKKKFIANEKSLEDPPKRLVEDNGFPPPDSDQPVEKDFLFQTKDKGNKLRYEMYMDYLNSSSHMHGAVPLKDSLFLFKEGDLEKPELPNEEG